MPTPDPSDRSDRPDLAEIEALATLLDSRTEAGDPPRSPDPSRHPDDLAATARAVRAASGPRHLSRRFADRLEENLMELAALDRPYADAPPRPAAPAGRWSSPSHPRPLPATGRRRGLVELAGLATVIALLFAQSMGIGGNLALWQDATPAPVTGDPTSGLLRVDSGRSGAYDSLGPTGTPTVLWTSRAPLPDPRYLQPIAGNGVLFVLDPIAGQISKVHMGGSIDLSVAHTAITTYLVDHGHVFVTSGYEGAGALTAYLDASPNERWRVATEPVAGALGFDGDRIFMVDTSGTLRAIDHEDGTEVWSVELALGSIGSFPLPPGFVVNDPSPAAVDGLLVVSTPAGEVRAFAAADGTPRWTFAAPETIVGAPTIVGDTVYVAARADIRTNEPETGHVYALDAATGAQRWSYALAAWERSVWKVAGASSEDVLVLTADGANVYVNGDGATGEAVTALSAETGEVAWSVGFGVAAGPAPVVAGGTLYAARPDGGVYALDTATGERRWRLDAGTTALRSPVVAAGLLLVTTEDGVVTTLGDGAETTVLDAQASPTVADETSVDISGLPACVAPRLRPDPLPTGEPAMSLGIPERMSTQGNSSVIRADLPTAPWADAEALVGILDTFRAMQACDRPGREAELGGFFTDDYYRRMAIRYPNTDLRELPWVGRMPFEFARTTIDDLIEPFVLDDGRVALLFWQEQTQDGNLYVFAEQGDAWLIDEVVRITKEPGQGQG